VKHWGTFNEIHHITFTYPNVGCRSPSGVCGDVHRQPYIIGHHMLLSHAKAVEIYRAKFQVTLNSVPIATLMYDKTIL
jgi:beta-glucosidase